MPNRRPVPLQDRPFAIFMIAEVANRNRVRFQNIKTTFDCALNAKIHPTNASTNTPIAFETKIFILNTMNRSYHDSCRMKTFAADVDFEFTTRP